MNFRVRLTIFIILLILPSLACQAVMGAVGSTILPTATASPTETLFVPSSTPVPTDTETPPTITPSPTVTPIPATPTATYTSTPRPTASPIHFRVLRELWSTVNQNYLYPDFNGLDWDAVLEEYLQRVAQGMSNEEFYLEMDEMIYSLGDDHSVYFSPEQAEEKDAEYAGDYDYVGIGILSTVVPDRDLITIIFTFPGSPAEQAGIEWHDNILAVDGHPIVDETGYRRDLLRGPEGSSVELTVQTPGQEPRNVTVQRKNINGPFPVPYQLLTSPSGNRIGYILMVTFGDSNTDEQIEKALVELTSDGPLDGLILDNRHNSGGSSDVLADTLAYFTNGTVGYFVEQQTERPLQISGQDISGSQTVPLTILIGEGTASFGEIFAGLLKDIGRATLIGEQTDGNVEILSIFNFSDGSRAWIAYASFRPLNHPDQDWEQTGILPDLIIPDDWDQATIENDAAIQAAMEQFDASISEE
jgi:C-terminal peptidase prc